MALFTLEELASVLQQDLDTASATLARATATALVEAVTGPIESRTSTVVLPLRAAQFIDLPSPVVTAVSAVEVDGTAATFEWLKPYPCVLLKAYTFAAVEWHTAEVTYTHGHTVIPEIVKAVALSVAARAYVAPPLPPAGTSVRIDDYAEATAASAETTGVMLTAHERRALDGFCSTTAYAL